MLKGENSQTLSSDHHMYAFEWLHIGWPSKKIDLFIIILMYRFIQGKVMRHMVEIGISSL